MVMKRHNLTPAKKRGRAGKKMEKVKVTHWGLHEMQKILTPISQLDTEQFQQLIQYLTNTAFEMHELRMYLTLLWTLLRNGPESRFIRFDSPMSAHDELNN